jgi:hypothetical protein
MKKVSLMGNLVKQKICFQARPYLFELKKQEAAIKVPVVWYPDSSDPFAQGCWFA